ncbi:hypothetical protein N7456_002337 [Penicillium angulare]|uniref:Tat pathway signal sequence n=1 Tax=Penicillium angulare TaxID=116970 RepID=A0A9W9KQ83_9EURO|nr:hypothetical protein N7456_002337 [Penicillium angulare]
MKAFWKARYQIIPSGEDSATQDTPANEAISYYETDFANAFNQKSQYRGPPTLELEKAWNDLWDQPEVGIPAESVIDMKKTTDPLSQYISVPEDEGTGYIGGLEVFHQLHCLNYIRQFTWFVMDTYTNETLPAEFNIPLKALRMHTDHCIETLRLVLMCQSDVTPVMVKWSESTPPIPEADFNSHHKCRNFDAIVAWNEAHAVKSWGGPPAHHDHHLGHLE